MNKYLESIKTTLGAIINYPVDVSMSIAYYLSNMIQQNHVLKTQAPVGVWHDLVTKVPDALMYAIIDFIEIECFHINIGYNNTEFDHIEGVKEYREQSYIRRKLFSKNVSAENRGKIGIDWLEFQMSNCGNKRDQQRSAYPKLIAAYKFAKERYFSFEPYEESGAKRFYETESDDKNLYREIHDTWHILEQEYDDLVTIHCTNIVKYRAYLWT